MPDIAEMNAWDQDRARRELSACCGSTRWVSGMLARRPFKSRERLFDAAAITWAELGPSDWLEAFAHHPRIGDRAGGGADRAVKWSSKEQGAVATAPETVREALAEANLEYEERFGFTYIVCATGRTAEEMLELLRVRLRNDRDTELAVGAEEQRKIMMLRLEKLLAAD